MFWASVQQDDNTLNALLESTTDCTLQAVLDNQYLLQQVRCCNDKLLEFLTSDAVLKELMETALRGDIDPSVDIKKQYKYSHMSAEVLSTNSDFITDAVLANDDARKILYSFLSENKEINRLVASFYSKIVCQVLGRFPEEMWERLPESGILSSIPSHFYSAAMAETIFKLVTTPSESQNAGLLKRTMVASGLVERMLSLLDPAHSSAEHDNVAYLWIEYVRTFRDIQYASEEKSEDALLDRFQGDEETRSLLDKMLARDSEGNVNESVSCNCAQILLTLFETNYIPHSPSRLDDDRNETYWTGGTPDGSNGFDNVQVWQPDPEHRVELACAERTGDIVETIVRELEKEERGETWLCLMQLLVAMCNTNHIPTHQLLKHGFAKGGLKDVFSWAAARPGLSLLHKQLHKLVVYILNTHSEQESPLLAYLFNELNLGKILLAGIRPVCVLRKMPLATIRSFHSFLASAVEASAQHAHNKDRIASLIRSCRVWSELEPLVREEKAYNRNDNPDGSTPASHSNHSALNEAGSVGKEAVAEENPSAAAQAALHDFEQQPATAAIPDATSRVPTTLASEIFECGVSTRLKAHIAAGLAEATDEAGEKAFEQLCALRLKAANDDDWLETTTTSKFESSHNDTFSSSRNHSTAVEQGAWPSTETSEQGENTVVDDWPASESAIREDFEANWGAHAKEVDDWPVVASGQKSDGWADFSTAVNSDSDWPSTRSTSDGGGGNDWPPSSAPSDSAPFEEPVDEIMAGYASMVVNANLEHTDA